MTMHERGEAADRELEARRGAGQRGEQGHRLEARLREETVADPERVEGPGRLGLLRQLDQIASLRRDVAPASAESRATASRRGFARRLSPTQSASKAPDASACCDSSIRSRAWIAPSTTARFARISPKDARAMNSSPRQSWGSRRSTSSATAPIAIGTRRAPGRFYRIDPRSSPRLASPTETE